MTAVYEDFDNWKDWINSHRDDDGTIDLNKHPALIEWMEVFLGKNYPENREYISGLQSTSEFKVKEKPADVEASSV